MNHHHWTSLNDPVCPLIVFDFRVHAHHINELYAQIETIDISREWLERAWVNRLSRCPQYLPMQPARVIVVDDGRHPDLGYWRHLLCRRLGLAEYKGSRDLPLTATEAEVHDREVSRRRLDTIVQVGYEVCKSLGLTVFRETFFEADDWAGAIYRIRRSGSLDRQVLLSTVDTDWHMLVDDKLQILWANTRDYAPVLRREQDVIDHTSRRLGKVIEHPSKLAIAKAECGDGADHLFPGSPLSLYDLTESNPEWPIEGATQFPDLVRELNDPQPNRPDGYELSRRWCLRNNLPIAL